MQTSVYYQTGTNQGFNTEEYNRIELGASTLKCPRKCPHPQA